MNTLQQQLDRLRVPQTVVRQYAVVAIFEALASPALPQHARDVAVRQCLQLKDQRALEVAVDKLREQARVGGFEPQDALDALLAALSVADAPSCGPLVKGVLSIWSTACTAGRSAPGSLPPPQHPVVAAGAASGIGGHDWGSHVLSRALQANPAAAQPLLQGVLRELAREAGTAGIAAGTQQTPPSRFLALLAALQPFIAFVLLSPDTSQQHPSLAADLHGGLARFACCGTAQQVQHAVLALLVGLLPARLVASPVQQGALVAAVGDILDVMESCSDEPEPTLVANLIAHLLALCFELVRIGGPSLPLLSALRHLSGYWPELLRPQLGLVAHLVPRLGGQECLAVLSLLGKQLNYTAKQGGLHPAEAALLLPPLLQLVAFSQDPTTKQWVSHCLAILASIRLTLGPAQLSGWGLQRLAGTPSGATAAEPAELSQQGGVSGQADVAMSQQTLRLLVEMWADEGEALRWLYSLEASLTAVASSSSGPQPGSKELAELDSYTASVLTGLLHHPSAAVQVAAVHCIEVAVKAIPLLGLSFLPVLVHRIQQLVESFLAGWEQSTPTSLLPMLRALPSLAQHAAVVPFVVRAIQPLLSSGSPEVLQALALRLLCLLWLRGGRGYQHLRTAILGFAAPGAAVGLELRVSRAESLRDICQEDPNRGLELVRVVQECLEDAAPQVQALGLRCIELLCEADCLDFYKAWRVVQARFPSLPSHPAAAAAWVALLAQGVLDADVYPEVARGTLSALWLAAANPSPQVRRQAYASLKEYSFELQEQIDALPPLIDFVDLLVAEQHPGNKAACEALVINALAHEHATRRRPGGLLGAEFGSRHNRARPARLTGQLTAAGKEAAVASHRLLVILPRLMLGGSASNTSEVLRRLPELSLVAVLDFYAPSAPPASSSAAGMAAAAREAAASYQLVFTELLKQAMPSQPATLACSAAMLLLPAWRRFLKRWAAALRAGARQQQQQQPASGAEGQANGPDSGAPAMAVWAAIRPQLSSSSPVAAENAVWAAAALCWVGQQPLKDAVHAVHAELSRLAGEAQAPAAVQRAALTALGALAGHVKSLLGQQEEEALVSTLLAALQQGPVSGTAARTAAAAAEGLGLACMELHLQATAGGGSLAGPAGQALLVVLGSLLGVLCTLCKGDGCDVTAVEAAAASMGLRLQQRAVDQRAARDGELLEAVTTGVVHAMTAATEVLQPSVLQAMHGVLLGRLQSTAQQGPQQQQELTAAPAAYCSLLVALTAAGFRQGWVTIDAVGNTLAALLGMLGPLGTTHGVQAAARPGPGGVDGRVVGAASAALGTMLPALLAQGFFPAAEQSPQAVLQSLASLLESPALSRLPHTAAAKAGLAAGIAGLLGPAAGIDPGSGLFKAALAALEGLALSDQDPRARQSAAAVLAEYCCQFRKRQGSRGAEAGSADGRTASAVGVVGGSSAARSLATLSDEGAMRPLVESLLEGRWAAALDASEEGSSDHPGLNASDAASILRCLAAAERLPALNFSTLCRRVLRSHPGDVAVELGCISLAAAHGQVQANQLADFISELLTSSRFQQLHPHAQHAVLRSLPRLLRSLPDSQAAAALQALGAICPGICSSDSESASAHADGAHLSWVAAFLEGLLGILAGRSGSTQQQQQQQQAQQAAAVPPPAIAVLRQVQQLLTETLLFCLPPPSTLPIGLSQQAVGVQAEQGRTPVAQPSDCWERVVQCFAAAFPADKLEDLLCSSFYSSLPLHTSFLAAALVARGAVSPRALQRARNLLINGELKSQPAQEDEVALLLGRAAATLPTGAAQQQWLQDGLDASAACGNPSGALKMVCCQLACIAAAAAAAAPAGSGLLASLASEHVAATSCAAAVATVAHSLAGLAESAKWRGSLGSIMHKFARGAAGAAAEAAAAGKEGAGNVGIGDGRGGYDWGKVVQAAMLSVRHQLPRELWATLATSLA